MRMLRLSMLCGLLLTLAACGGEASPGRIEFTLTLTGLPVLPARMGFYEGWALVSGVPVSTGRFTIDASTSPATVRLASGAALGPVTGAAFGPASTGLGSAFPLITTASGFFITIEAPGAMSGVPSNCVVMAGDFTGSTSALSMSGVAHGNTNWSLGSHQAASAAVLKASPSDGNAHPEQGLWFVGDAAGMTPGFTGLPVHSDGWRYEAWTTDGVPGTPAAPGRSMGTFTSAAGRDADALSSPTRGIANPGFAFPGADFLTAFSASGAAIALADGAHEVLITIEPAEDNAEGPFPITILGAAIPASAVAGGVTAADITLAPVALPALTLAATAADVTLTGDGFREQGGAHRGEYVLWAALPPLSEPVLVARLVREAGLMRSVTTGLLVGSPSNVVLTAFNTGLGAAFPDLGTATTAFITFEAQGGPSFGLPNGAPLYAGAVSAGSASLTVAGTTGLGLADFSSAAGTCILAAPTRSAGTPGNDGNGLWFVDRTARQPSLTLPALPFNWKYEGWVRNTTTGVFTSTGKFRSTTAADENAQSAPGHDLGVGYAAPGADFLSAWQRDLPASVAANVLVTLVPAGWSSLHQPAPFALFFGAAPLAGGGMNALANLASSWPSGSVSY